jgi:hypothetical protein
MKLLHDRSKLVTYEADTKAWTALQLAAAFGTRQDMELMLQIWRACNGDVHLRSQPIGWEAIHYAVQAGNLPTFSVLLKDHGDIEGIIRRSRMVSTTHRSNAAMRRITR